MERKASTARSDLEKMLVDETAEPKALPLSLLEDITGGFSDDQVIGSGGFAVVYKGILGDRAVAVKRLSNAYMHETHFHGEVQCLMRVKHKNVVRFLGYCADTQGDMRLYNGKLVMADVQQRLLCFEYIPKGSLDKYIIDAYHEWGTCYEIIKGICEGIRYLHDNNIIHLDLKPANILLDDNMIPKITDFGLSKCFDENQSRHFTKNVAGTMGYIAPERHQGAITRSADLYSLGVIIMEILTGNSGDEAIEDVLESWSDRLQRSQRDTLCQQLRVCYEIALECRDFNPKKRPASARNIIDRLHVMEIPTGEAASSISGVARGATESKKGNTDDPGRGAHPLAGQTVVMPRAASTSPLRVTLHAVAGPHPPPGQTVVMPSPAGPALPATLGSSSYRLVETKLPLPAKLGARSAVVKFGSTYGSGMVEPMFYLYVSVIKARDLPINIIGSLQPFVDVKLGNFRGVTLTQYCEQNANPVWRQTFAISGVHFQSSQLEVIVKDKDVLRYKFVGRVVFDMSDVPFRLPPDSPLAPQWYRLADAHGNTICPHGHHGFGEIMLAVWLGTQADEAFPEADGAFPEADGAFPDAQSLSQEGLTNTCSNVYLMPKLIYLKVSVITAQDLIAADKGRPLAATVAKIQTGNQIRQTRPQGGTANPVWNEEFMFVATEPFEDPLVVTVEEKVAAGRDKPIGGVIIPVNSPHVPRNDLAKPVPSKWFNLSRAMTMEAAAADATTSIKFAGKIHLKLSLETAYHVLEESTQYSSDLQPAANNLRKSAIGVLDVSILSARCLGGNKKNPYCVAKYGAKWVRTRTLLATSLPQWNEHYAWEVFDLSTVITVAVFDNANLHHGHGDGGNKDQRIGKVRVQLTTLESDRVYTHYYPLMALSTSGLKKTGELHLAVRFTCTAWANMLVQYGRPLLPKMHYTNPISELQLDYVRFQAMQMVARHLGKAEPPLRREVVEYMLDVDSHMFSLHRSKANLDRITSLFSGAVAVGEWFDGICKWKNPLATILVHVMFFILVCYPEVILPTVFVYLFMMGAWNYLQPSTILFPVRFFMLKQIGAWNYLQAEEVDTLPPVLDSVSWYAYQKLLDELDEEFDTFPTSRSDDIMEMRYDRLRSIAGRLQTVAGVLATQAERAQSLLCWDDPRATSIFITLSLVMAVIMYMTPLRVVATVMGLYFLRPPWFRSRSNRLFNFYSRLPSKDDVMI